MGWFEQIFDKIHWNGADLTTVLKPYFRIFIIVRLSFCPPCHFVSFDFRFMSLVVFMWYIQDVPYLKIYLPRDKLPLYGPTGMLTPAVGLSNEMHGRSDTRTWNKNCWYPIVSYYRVAYTSTVIMFWPFLVNYHSYEESYRETPGVRPLPCIRYKAIWCFEKSSWATLLGHGRLFPSWSKAIDGLITEWGGLITEQF